MDLFNENYEANHQMFFNLIEDIEQQKIEFQSKMEVNEHFY